MVKSLIDISERANKVVNMVKVMNGLKNKSQAINTMTREYEKFVLTEKFRPEFIKKLERVGKEKTVKVKMKDFDRHFGLK